MNGGGSDREEIRRTLGNLIIENRKEKDRNKIQDLGNGREVELEKYLGGRNCYHTSYLISLYLISINSLLKWLPRHWQSTENESYLRDMHGYCYSNLSGDCLFSSIKPVSFTNPISVLLNGPRDQWLELRILFQLSMLLLKNYAKLYN